MTKTNKQKIYAKELLFANNLAKAEHQLPLKVLQKTAVKAAEEAEFCINSIHHDQILGNKDFAF